MSSNVAENDLEKMETGTQNISTEDQLRNVLTNTMSISPELFERLYLGPQNKVSGDLRKTFANPTPLGILGFSVGLFPLAIEFMGWRGSGGYVGAQTTTCSLFFGGLLLWVAGTGEFILGNTFPFVVFFGYGAHFMTFCLTFVPWFGAVRWTAKGDPFTPTAPFAAGFGFYPVAMGMLSLLFFFCALRTNLVFVLIFVCATTGFGLAAAAEFYTAIGYTKLGVDMLYGAGAVFWAADLLGWYLLFAQMFSIMELPVPEIPVFDLTKIIKAKKKKGE